MNQYAVWCASAGCLPDNDGPEFEGPLEECEAWVAENAVEYDRPWVEHNLYNLWIEEQ